MPSKKEELHRFINILTLPNTIKPKSFIDKFKILIEGKMTKIHILISLLENSKRNKEH